MGPFLPCSHMATAPLPQACLGKTGSLHAQPGSWTGAVMPKGRLGHRVCVCKEIRFKERRPVPPRSSSTFLDDPARLGGFSPQRNWGRVSGAPWSSKAHKHPQTGGRPRVDMSDRLLPEESDCCWSAPQDSAPLSAEPVHSFPVCSPKGPQDAASSRTLRRPDRGCTDPGSPALLTGATVSLSGFKQAAALCRQAPLIPRWSTSRSRFPQTGSKLTLLR